MSKYRKYDPDIKQMIIETRNPNLFPELDIPRTTALYWIKNAGKIRKKTAYKEGIQKQKDGVARKLNQERYKTFIVSEVLKKNLKNSGRKGREEIVKLFDNGKKEYGLYYSGMCNLIGIHVGTFKQWRVDIYGCSYNFKKCDVAVTNKLLDSELKEMLKLLRDKNFVHYSLKSLSLYAKRKGLVYASVTTWYKYMKMYEVKRERCRKGKRRSKIGVRSNVQNELWHIDVTQFKLRGGRKVYLQIIVDNYSRYIVDYEFSETISAQMISMLIKRALQRNDVKSLMSDAGVENNNKLVKQITIGRNIKFLISGKNTTWKNAMVESVFAAIKRKRRDFKAETEPALVIDYVESVINEYNNQIPHSVHEGGTPYEIYHDMWGIPEKIELNNRHISMLNSRKMIDLTCTC